MLPLDRDASSGWHERVPHALVPVKYRRKDTGMSTCPCHPERSFIGERAMTLRSLWMLTGMLALFSLIEPGAGAKPNLVFVWADQWRACPTGYAGLPNVKTPNLHRPPAA